AETKGIAQQYADQGLQAVTPPTSLFAAFPVALVTENAERNGSTEVSTEYLAWLYSPQAQETLAQNHFRTTDPAVTAKYAAEFPEVKLLTVDEVFGGWDKVTAEHLAEGGILDTVFINQ